MTYSIFHRTKYLVSAFAFISLSLFSVQANAANYNGRIDLVQSTGANSTSVRYFISSQSLSLYATGAIESIIRDAFFREANVSIVYQPTICPNGILGTCGNVSSVTVHAINFR